jgi:low temperature requirement protein LtrA
LAAIILMASRLSLTIEYGSILWHVRKFKNVHLPFYIQMAIHFIAAMIYLGITFRFDEDKNSRVFIAWYVVGALEVISTLGLSIFFSILGLAKTHLMNRMSLLTIVVLGESIVALAEKVVIIVEGPDAWGKYLQSCFLHDSKTEANEP